jgi:hypothetical protein
MQRMTVKFGQQKLLKQFINKKFGYLRASLLVNLVPHFLLLRELTTPLKPIVLVNYQGHT